MWIAVISIRRRFHTAQIRTVKDNGAPILPYYITEFRKYKMQSIPFFHWLSGKHGSKNLQSFFTWIRRWCFCSKEFRNNDVRTRQIKWINWVMNKWRNGWKCKGCGMENVGLFAIHLALIKMNFSTHWFCSSKACACSREAGGGRKHQIIGFMA